MTTKTAYLGANWAYAIQSSSRVVESENRKPSGAALRSRSGEFILVVCGQMSVENTRTLRMHDAAFGNRTIYRQLDASLVSRESTSWA